MGELDGARNAGAESNAVVGAVDVVVHGLRNGDDVHTLVVQPFPVTEGVVASNRDQHVDPDVLEILEHILGDVVDLLVVAGEMLGHASAWQVTRPRPGSVEEGAAGSSGAIHFRL